MTATIAVNAQACQRGSIQLASAAMGGAVYWRWLIGGIETDWGRPRNPISEIDPDRIGMSGADHG
jgi:hypothetical protein